DVPGCEYGTLPILLPFPNPPEKIPDPCLWPDEHWRAYIVCPGCGQLSRRGEKNIQWGGQDPNAVKSQLSNTAWVCIAFECGETGCGMQIQLYLEMPADSSSVDILNEIQGRTIRGRMVCGHWLSIGAPWGIFRVIGPIPSYALIGLDSDYDPISEVPKT